MIISIRMVDNLVMLLDYDLLAEKVINKIDSILATDFNKCHQFLGYRDKSVIEFHYKIDILTFLEYMSSDFTIQIE